MKSQIKKINNERRAHFRSGILASLVIGASMLLSIPGVVFAAPLSTASAYCATGVPDTVFGGSGKFDSAVKFVVCFLEQFIVPFLFAIAVVVFFWGMVKFMSTNDTAEREQGKQVMLWGVIGLAVMFCVWGLVYLFSSTFGVRDLIPQLPVN